MGRHHRSKAKPSDSQSDAAAKAKKPSKPKRRRWRLKKRSPPQTKMLTPEMFEDETAAEILAIVSSVQNKDSWLEDSTWTEESEDKSQTSVSLLPTDLRLKKKSISKICSTSELAQARLVVNHRVAQSFSKWENRNNVSLDEPVQVKAIDECTLPTGFGFHLCKETYYTRKFEPELSRLYDVIRTVPDRETQDLLLCFLDDFKVQREVQHCADHTRVNLLKTLKSWFRNAQEHLSDDDVMEPLLLIKDSLERDEGLRAQYLLALTAMSRLKFLVKGEIMPVHAPETCDTPNQADTPTGQTSKTAIKPKKMNAQLVAALKKYAPCKIFHDMVIRNANAQNREACNSMATKMEDLVLLVDSFDTKHARMRRHVFALKEETEDCRQFAEAAERELARVFSTISKEDMELMEALQRRNIISLARNVTSLLVWRRAGVKHEERPYQFPQEPKPKSEKPEKPAKHAKPAKKVITKPPCTDAEVQTDPIQLTPQFLSVRRAGSRMGSSRTTPMSARSPTNLTPAEYRYRLYNVSVESMAQVIQDNIAKMRGERIPVSRMPMGNTVIPQVVVKLGDEVIQKTQPTAVTLKTKKETSKVKIYKSGNKLTIAEMMSWRGTLHFLEGLKEIDKKNLLAMAKILAENLVRHSQNMSAVLSRLRADALQDFNHMERKEGKITKLSSRLKAAASTLQTFNKKNFPSYTTPPNSIVIIKKCRPQHKCRFCSCQLITGDEELDTKWTAEAVGKTLEDASKYCSALTNLRLRYKDLMEQLEKTSMFIEEGLLHLSWSEGDLARGCQSLIVISHEEEAVAAELMERLQEEMQGDDLRVAFDFLWLVAAAMAKMSFSMLNVVRQTKSRLREFKSHMNYLDDIYVKVEATLNDANTSMIEVARLRSRPDGALVSGLMIRNVQCKYCKCYNVPFMKDPRQWVVEKDSADLLAAALGSVMQGHAAVQVLDNDKDIILAIDEKVQKEMWKCREAILSALDCQLKLSSSTASLPSSSASSSAARVISKSNSNVGDKAKS